MPLFTVAVGCIAVALCYFAILSFTKGKTRVAPPAATEPTDVEDYYDAESMGVREVASGRLHAFPLYLVQQIDAGIESSDEPERVTFYVTAECNYAQFQFSAAAAEDFLSVMERSLPSFDGTAARRKIANAFSSGEGATIYVSPDYPDADIFPKFKTAK